MTDQEQVTADQYRFQGYQLDLLIFDETGPAYAYAHVHPYYYNQPLYWQQNSFQGGQIVGGQFAMEQSGNAIVQVYPPTNTGESAYKETMFRMLSF